MATPLPSEADNPLTLVYDGLWDLVERNNLLEQWLDPANKEKFHRAQGRKRDITTSDTPELILVSGTKLSNLKANSSSTFLTASYTWILVTGDQRLNRVLNQVTWEIFRSMADWDSILCSLTWPPDDPKAFVLQANLTEIVDSPPGENIEDEKGILGWTSLWTVQVQMNFTTADLRI